MKRTTTTIMGLVLSTAFAAQAQTSSTTATTAPATQSSAISAAAAQPSALSKVTGLALMEAWTAKDDVQNNAAGLQVDSVISLGIGYKVTPKSKVEFRYRTQARTLSDKDMSAAQAGAYGPMHAQDAGNQTQTNLQDPTLHYNYNSEVRLLGSEPLALGTRYYIPASRASTLSKSLGVLRANTSVDWNLNTKVQASIWAQTRLYLNSTANNTANNTATDAARAQGSDSVLRVIVGPAVTYNFSDKLNAYYAMYTDAKSTTFQRGEFSFDNQNQLWQEVGFNITAGPVSINPAYLTYADRRNSDRYNGFGEGQNSEYDLIISASF